MSDGISEARREHERHEIFENMYEEYLGEYYILRKNNDDEDLPLSKLLEKICSTCSETRIDNDYIYFGVRRREKLKKIQINYKGLYRTFTAPTLIECAQKVIPYLCFIDSEDGEKAVNILYG